MNIITNGNKAKNSSKEICHVQNRLRYTYRNTDPKDVRKRTITKEHDNL